MLLSNCGAGEDSLIPWTSRRSSQSVLKEINPECSGRTEAEAEAPTFWPLDVKSQLIGKNPDAGKDWGQEEKGATEDKMVGWHQQLNDMSLSNLWEMVKDREVWHAAVPQSQSWTQLSNWASGPKERDQVRMLGRRCLSFVRNSDPDVTGHSNQFWVFPEFPSES